MLDWLLLAALGIIWAAFLIPSGGRRTHSPHTSVEEFERNMDLLAGTEDPGRWVVTPKKGTRFVGARARERSRVRARRRRVLGFLVETTVLSFMIGLVPPLRSVWLVTGLLFVLTAGYVWLLLRLKAIETGGHGRANTEDRGPARRYQAVAKAGYAQGKRFVSEGRGRSARPSYAGLPAVDEDYVHVVVQRP